MVNVRINALRKEFGSVVAVDDIDITAHNEEFITVVGPSGSGKTTVIRIIAGLEDATSGEIFFGDREVTNELPQERDVAMMFQDVALYPHMTVQDNIAYGLKIAGIKKKKRYEKVDEIAEMLQISDQLNKNPTELSGGQQQRVALGRSMIREPSVFLFDEAMSDLDAKLKRELRPLIEEVANELECPMIYVTHDQEEAMTMSDKIIVMRDGRIEQSGTPGEVYRNPATTFVGKFIGQPEMQFFNGKLEKTDKGVYVNIGEYHWPLPADYDVEAHIDSKIQVGVRPQHLSVEKGTNDDGLQATHALDEPLGDRTNSFFDTKNGRIVVVTDAEFRGAKGEEYTINVDPSKTKIFDPDDGVRIT